MRHAEYESSAPDDGNSRSHHNRGTAPPARTGLGKSPRRGAETDDRNAGPEQVELARDLGIPGLGYGYHTAYDNEHPDGDVQEEHPTPPRAIDQPAADERPGRPGDAAQSRPGSDRSGPVVGTEARLKYGQAPGGQKSRSHSCQYACPDQYLDVRCGRTQRRSHGEPDSADQEYLPAAVAVAQGAAEQDERRQSQQISRQDPLQPAHARMEVVTYVRERHVHHGGIE